MMKFDIGVGRKIVFAAVLVGLCSVPARAQYGRTYGGYTGGYLGAVGGSAVGTALVTAAGISNPLVGGAIVTTSALGSGLVGARVGSSVGDRVDHRAGTRRVWSAVGALSGGLMGFTLAPGGNMIARVLGAGVGALAGGFLGNYYARKADKDFNPRSVGALVGGVNGALLGGPVGAAVGVPLGYIGGDVLDRKVFGDRHDLPRGSHRYRLPSVSGWFDRNGFDADGYDREGYDRIGFDRDGHDREGYDRFGYDRDGLDRLGYDLEGFRETRIGRRRSRGSRNRDDVHYDRDLYDRYWKTYSHLGGDYPDFGEEHWERYPRDRREGARERYHDKVGKGDPVSVSGAPSSPASVSQAKARHDAALERIQKLTGDPSTTPAQLQAAHGELKAAEAALSSAMSSR